MEKRTRDWISQQMEVFLKKFPSSDLKKIREFVLSGSREDGILDGVKKDTLQKFIWRIKKKFEDTGSCLQRRHTSGRPKTVLGNREVVNKVTRMFLNKATRGQRSVARKFGILRTSVWNILKTKNIKPYHKVREQALEPHHKAARVRYCRWMLRNLGQGGNNANWRKLVNTDFSAIVRTHLRHNSKNMVVYGRDKNSIREKLSNPEKKFAPFVMLWGGITTIGLVPADAPLFVDEVLSEWENPDGKQPKTINSFIYTDMIQTKVLPEVQKLFPDLDCWFQDDEARIHRTQHVLDPVDATFPQRVPAKMASCTADLLPIENIWAIIKQELPKYGKMENITKLKRAIKTI